MYLAECNINASHKVIRNYERSYEKEVRLDRGQIPCYNVCYFMLVSSLAL